MIAICVVDWCAATGATAVFWIAGAMTIGWLFYKIAGTM